MVSIAFRLDIFRTLGTLLEPSAMGRLAGAQEPIGKTCPVRSLSMHGGVFVCAGSVRCPPCVLAIEKLSHLHIFVT
jgi:hypothetical protein